jgi:hypothetical protein
MNYDYNPLNPVIWGIFIGAWVIIGIIGNAYRKKYHLSDKERQGE